MDFTIWRCSRQASAPCVKLFPGKLRRSRPRKVELVAVNPWLTKQSMKLELRAVARSTLLLVAKKMGSWQF